MLDFVSKNTKSKVFRDNKMKITKEHENNQKISGVTFI